MSITDFYCLTGKSDHTLNISLFFIHRILEQNNISTLWFVKPVCKPESNEPVMCHDRILHRSGWNLCIDNDKMCQHKHNYNHSCKHPHPTEYFFSCISFLFIFQTSSLCLSLFCHLLFLPFHILLFCLPAFPSIQT